MASCYAAQDDSDSDSESPDWTLLPSVVLEHVLSLLPPRDRHSLSLVCRHWSRSLHAARPWAHLHIHHNSFTVKDFSILLGFHRRFETEKMRNCMEQIGQHIRKLTILPIDNYIHMQQLINGLFIYSGYLKLVKEFSYTNSCETKNRAGSFLHGVGEPILKLIMDFLTDSKNIKIVTLNQLMLSREAVLDFQTTMQGISSKLVKLELRNTSVDGTALHNLGNVANLQVFITSPQQIDDVLLIKLAESGLKMLHLVQDKFTGYAAPVNQKAWASVRKINPSLRVKLICCGLYKHDVLIQQGAPVSHVVYDTPYSVISPVTISGISEYSDTLTVYGHKSLPRIHGRINAHDRADSLILRLIAHCPNLERLIIRDRISSASVLLIAKTCNKLKHFHVRRNSLLTRLDWSQDQRWSDEFYHWLKKNCRSMEKMEEEVGKILGYGWRTLTDGEYSQLSDVDL